jgi:hypothetical protein
LTVLDALQTPNRSVKGEVHTFTGTTIAENAVYAPIADILAASEGLITEYERLCKTITDLQEQQTEPAVETWQQELQETEQRLQMGARVAVKNVKKVLGADLDVGTNGTNENAAEEIREDREAEQELNYELQKSLRYMERGVKRMVKGLPNDEHH